MPATKYVDFKLYLETAFLVVVSQSENAEAENIGDTTDFIQSKNDGINDGINTELMISGPHKSVYQTIYEADNQIYRAG